MIVKVKMLAFRNEHTIREVIISDEAANDPIAKQLDEVFREGQNDFQPVEGMPSVSVGDVILLDGRNFVVKGIGFKELTTDELTEYARLPQHERAMALC